MKEKIIKLFNKSGKEKIIFNPSIRIKMTPHEEPVWMESMTKIKDSYMVATINRSDKANRNLNSLNDNELNSLLIRLWSLFGVTKGEVFEKLKKIVYTSTFTEDITEESTLDDDLDLDNLDMLDQVKIIMECEKEFHVSIPYEEFEGGKTVQQLLDVICTKLSI